MLRIKKSEKRKILNEGIFMTIDVNEYTTLTIDRFEGNFAICETKSGATLDLDIDLVDKKAKEGDIITCKDGLYLLDEEATSKRKEKIKALTQKIIK